MSDDSNTLTISKNLYYYACAGVAILAIALLITLYKLAQEPPTVVINLPKDDPVIRDGKNPNFSEETKKFLQEGDYDKVVFINEDSQVKLVDKEGNDIPPCALSDGKKFTGVPGRDCHFEDIDLTNLTSIAIPSRRYNPGGNCPIINGRGHC